MKIVSKKHWYSYIAIIIVFPITYILLFTAPSFLDRFIEGIPLIEYLRYIPFLYGLWFLYVSIMGPILNASKKWEFENGNLTVQSSFRGVFNMDISQIYEAYYNQKFLGSIFGFGTITVRRTDGTASNFSEKTMTNCEKMVMAINDAVLESKKTSNQPTIIKTENSLSDELKKLSELHKDGLLTDEEYEKSKRKLIE